MWQKMKNVMKGVGGSLAIGAPVAAFDTVVGLVVVLALLVPTVLYGLYLAGRSTRKGGLLSQAQALTQAKEELVQDGIPLEQQTRAMIELRAANIMAAKKAEREEKKAAKEQAKAMREAEQQAVGLDEAVKDQV